MAEEKKITFTHSTLDAINETADGWQQVAPYCNAPYWDESGNLQGVQIFTREIAQKLVDGFNSKITALKNWFIGSNGNIPFYNGHPDHISTPEEKRDLNVYAEADALEARDNGLWAHVVKKPILDTLKDAFGKREISPRWRCRVEANGSLIPIDLISFGLVDKGNLPNADAINARQDVAYLAQDKNAIKSLAELVGIEEENATAEAILEAVKNLQTSLAELEAGALAPETKIQELENTIKARDSEIDGLKKNLAELNETLTKLKTDNIMAENETAFDAGEISVEQKDEIKALIDAGEIDKAIKKLAEIKAKTAQEAQAVEEAKESSSIETQAQETQETQETQVAQAQEEDKSKQQAENAEKAIENSYKSFWDYVESVEKSRNVSRRDAIKICQNTKIGFDLLHR